MWHRTLDWWRLSHKIYEKTFRREKFSTKQILYFVFLRGVDIARPVWGFAVFGTALKLKMIRVKVQLSKRIHPFFSILEYIQCELQIYYLIREILNWPLSTFSFLSFQCSASARRATNDGLSVFDQLISDVGGDYSTIVQQQLPW